ncbi:hypothetical protein [Bacteroides xylanisolvens]|uniref:hypothetical protein n=1 Tax=Bacteroides xylanisolvens TaxID=371601 RepID=UPI001896E7E4|nr:hypothetical protein [Bacteroides xylanisolvens]
MGTGFPHLSYIFDNSKQADMRRIAGQCACIAYVVVSVWLMVYVSDAFYMGEKKKVDRNQYMERLGKIRVSGG